MSRLLVRLVLSFACLLPVVAFAQQPVAKSAVVNIDIPAGNLVTALDMLARQAGVQFVYSTSQLAGLRTQGAHGSLNARSALDKLLEGTGYHAHRDDSGAMVIVKDAGNTKRAKSTPSAPAATSKPDEAAAKNLKSVVVTGSRIPQSQVEGPAPVITITAQDIQQRGLVTVPDIMTSLTQNVGDLRNNQYTNGFAPGAQAVDLRGLGPSYTLVLVNGRRFADYPQAYRGNSNFSDISNIPASLIDRVEVLSGSASAVYGSDAISGVINFILKQKADGTTLDFRAGATEHGGAGSQRLDITSGFSSGKLDTIFGLELYRAKPLYDYQRSYTDSRLDSPADPSDINASGVFVRTDVDGYYLDPGKATCDSLSHLDQGSVFYAQRAGYGYGGPGYYCGSYDDIGYGTLKNSRKMANLYASATYHFNANTDFYVNALAGTSHQEALNSMLQWSNCEPINGDCADTPFYNSATGQVEQWQRRYFTYEENGGLGPAQGRIINNTLSLNTGVKGTFGSDSYWDYEANFEHSENTLKSKYPELLAAKAQALYLGPSLGIDPDSGYKIYDAPPGRLYTPLTVEQFRSIAPDSIDRNTSRTENWSLTLTNTNLFQLPAGPVGFAGIAEYGNSYLGQHVDLLSLDGSYYGLHNTNAIGSRSHAALGYEFSVPVFSQLTLSTAGRYDNFKYGDKSAGKFTYALGVEYRPFRSLLLRGSLSTGFRAPDLSYLYSGLSGSSSGGTDYYLCRRDEPDTGPDFYDNCNNGYVYYDGRSHGSIDLKDESSKSYTYGFVYSPAPNFDVSADYFHIKLRNKVQYQDSQTILRREADCRLGVDKDGNPVDGNSTYCQQIESQVVRNPASAPHNPEGITSVLVVPINLASDQTSGVDFKTHYRLDAHRAGKFEFMLGATYVSMHKTQTSPDVPVDNQLTDIYNYGIPRMKANASATWMFHNFTGTLYGARLSGIPNYDGDKRLAPTFLYNMTLGYQITPDINLSLVVDNVFDKRPQYDPTWTSYPYYYRSWFSPVGRAYYLQLNVHFGAGGN